jgi:hypothetical protein
MPRLAVSLLLLAAACAAPQEPRSTLPPGETPPTAAAAEEQQVCREERVTGSNMMRTVCRPQFEVDREREEAQLSTKNSRMMQTAKGN